MSLEKMRILSLLIVGAAVMAFLSGDFGANFFIIQIMVTLPLWLPLELSWIRRWNFLWKLLGMLTLLLFFMSLTGAVPLSPKSATFGLVMFCVAYEFYGENREDAPLRLIGLLSFLIMIYQARIESGLNLLVGVVIYLLTLIFVMMSFHLGRVHHYQIPRLIKAYKLPILGHAVCVFAIGLMVYWVLPRLPGQSLGVLRGFDAGRLSGFSDRVSLNDIGSLKLSRKHVMDLTPLDGLLHSHYLKGKVLDTYQDGVWTYTMYTSGFKREDQPNRFVFQGKHDQTFTYRIDLNPIYGNNLFFFDNLLELTGPLSPMRILGDEDNIAVMKQVPVAFSYKIIAEAMPKRAVRGFHTDAYEEVPQGLEFIGEIADGLFAETPLMSDHDKAAAMVQYYEQNYTYSLDIVQDGEEPLEDFMLTQKKGHCELFASSMVMMLRSQGIPARLVTGFLVPAPHPSGGFYHITEADAHAWVEYAVDGYWFTIDPTPPTDYAEPGFFENVSVSVSRFWRNIILSWNYESQVELLQSLLNNARITGALIAEHAVGLVLVLILLGGALVLVWRGTGEGGNRRRLTLVFLKLDGALQARFAPRLPLESGRDYLQRIDLDPQLRGDLLTFVDDYQHLRFGKDSARQVAGLEQMARDLLKRVKST